MATEKPIALLTGGGGYIGGGIAKALADDGWRLVIVDINVAATDKIAAAIGPAVIDRLACDIRDHDQVHALVAGVIARHGVLGGLVTAAGSTPAIGPRAPFWETELENWTLTVTTFLHGALNFCHAVLPHMRDNRRGAIVNVASGAGLPGGPPITRQQQADVYGATKAGIIAFTKSIALEHAADGIRANCIAPGRSGSSGRTAEEMMRRAAQEDARLAGSSRMSPLGRFGRAEDMGQAVAFLMSERASYITGSCLDVSGGMRLH